MSLEAVKKWTRLHPPRHKFRLFVYTFFVLPVLIFYSQEVEQDFSAKSYAVKKSILKSLQRKPTKSQDSIYTAIWVYDIEVPKRCEMPEYDPFLRERGETVFNGPLYRSDVRIGPSAFESWGMLGSTLAHELEVHCRQNLLFYSGMQWAGLKGTLVAENDAYNYELSQVERFMLSKDEIKYISEVAHSLRIKLE